MTLLEMKYYDIIIDLFTVVTKRTELWFDCTLQNFFSSESNEKQKLLTTIRNTNKRNSNVHHSFTLELNWMWLMHDFSRYPLCLTFGSDVIPNHRHRLWLSDQIIMNSDLSVFWYRLQAYTPNYSKISWYYNI